MNSASVAKKSDSTLIIVDYDDEDKDKKDKSLQENFKAFMTQRKVRELIIL